MEIKQNIGLQEDETAVRHAVMLVDDDSKLLRSLKRALADQNYEVVTAISAAEAMAMIPLQKIDLLLSDNLMAGKLGTEFLEEVRRRFPHIVLMMLSGYMPKSTADRMTDEIGVARILSKPCRAAEIVRAIGEELGVSLVD